MSVVIAIKDKDRIVIGCDSEVGCGQLKGKLDNKNTCKIWKIENCENGLMGCVGYLRDAQLIQCEDNLIDELSQLKNNINFKYVVKKLCKKLYDILNDNHRIENNSMSSTFIFAYKDMAFKISEDLTVTPIEEFLVIGCGDEVATGILAINSDKPVEKRIEEAIKICAENIYGIDNNIIIKYTNI